MSYETRLWLHKLVAALVSGGAGAVTAGFSANLIDPQAFNLVSGTTRVLELMAVTFVVNGLLGMAAFLKDKPVPDLEAGEDRRVADGGK